ncbi:MAG: histidine triad nucleotide-binding protein [Thermodesulfobacteriota bacterium]
MDDCVFCKIVQGSLPSRRVYEDETVVAFHDVNPVGPIHVLIVPRTHFPTMNDLAEDDKILSHMGKAARNIARDLGIDRDGYRFYVNVGRGGGQVVFHLHAHLIAGRSLGMALIKIAVGFAIVSRKLLALLGLADRRM